MEALAVEQKLTPEREKQSFDVLASVHLFRSDIENYGEVLPETKERVYDEELTFVAEGINRPLYTAFEIRSVDGQLSYFHEGKWKSYLSMLVTGLETAQNEAEKDPRKNFLEERAADDLQKGYEFESMEPGQTLVWHSPFPEQESELYGEKFLKAAGFQPERKMGFIYRAQKNEDGSLTLESHSVDNSDKEAFAQIYETLDYDPHADMDVLVRSYDGSLRKNYGQEFRAGRPAGQDSEEEAWNFLKASEQRELLNHYFGEIEELARSSKTLFELEDDKKRLTYGMWAALKRKLDEKCNSFSQYQHSIEAVYSDPAEEIRQGFAWAASRGEVMAGCGGSIQVGNGIESLEPSEALDYIFGANDKKNSYSFNKEMFCVVCQAPPEEDAPKKMCGPCGICRECDSKM